MFSIRTTRSIPVEMEGHSPQSPSFGTQNLTPGDYVAMVETYLEARQPYQNRWILYEALYDKDPSLANATFEQPVPPRNTGRPFGLVQTGISALFNNRPRVYVEPMRGGPGSRDEARMWESVVNSEWGQRTALTKEQRVHLTNCHIYGAAVSMTTYEADFEKILRSHELRHAATEKAEKNGDLGALAESRLQEALEEQHAPESDLTYEYDLRVLNERVASRDVDMWDFLKDPLAKRPEQWRWVGRRLEIPRIDLEKSPFRNVKGLKCDTQFAERFWPKEKIRSYRESSGLKGGLHDWVTLFEIWDIVRNKLVVVAPGYDRFLRNQEIPYFLPHPFQYLSWFDRGANLYPISDLGVAYDSLVKEADLHDKLDNALAREMIDVYLTDAQAGLGHGDVVPLKAPDGSIFLPVQTRDQSRPIQTLVHKLPRDTKSPDILNYIAAIRVDIQESSGFGPNQRGAPNKSGTTATEAREIGDFSRTKQAFKFRAVEEFVADISFARMALYAQFYDSEDILYLAGPSAALLWGTKRFTKGDLQHRFSVRVEEGSTAPVNAATRSAMWQKIFMTGLQIPIIGQIVDIRKCFIRWLEAEGVKDGDDLWLPGTGKEASQILLEFVNSLGVANLGGGGASPASGGISSQVPEGSAAGGEQAGLGALLGGAFGGVA